MKDTQLIVWDMDGTLYPYDAAFLKAANENAITMLHKALPQLSRDDVVLLEASSYERYGSSFRLAGELYELDTDELLANFHDNLSDATIKPATADERTALRETETDHAILTMAQKSWTQRVLNRLELFEFFSTHNTITAEDYAPYHKPDHTEPYIHTLDIMGCQAERAIMVEDSVKNLKRAKEIGMTTVLVYPKSPIKENYVDLVFPTPTDFLKHFKQCKLAS